MGENKMVTTAEKVTVYLTVICMSLVACFVGLGEIISFVLLPAILAYSVVRLNYRHIVFESMLVLLCFSLATGSFAVYAFFSICPGIVLGVCIRKKKSLRFALTASALAWGMTEVLNYVGASMVSDETLSFVQVYMQETEQLIGTFGLPASESAMVLDMLSMYLPSILVLSVSMLAYGAFLVVHRLLRWRMPEIAILYPRFRDLSVRKTGLMILAISAIAAFADHGVFGTVAANLMMLICFYVILCGYALMISMISALRSGTVRFLLYFGLVWMFSMVSPAAFFLGLTDAFLHFRNRKRGDIE